MDDKIRKFLLRSGLFIVLFIIVFFLVTGFSMEVVSRRSVAIAGRFYMQGLNEAISRHFVTVVTQNFDSLQYIINNDVKNGILNESQAKKTVDALGNNSYSYLAYLLEDGSMEMIMGGRINLDAPELVIDALKNGQNRVTVSSTEDGQSIYAVCIPIKLYTPRGNRSLALVGGMPSQYLVDAMSMSQSLTDMSSSSIMNVYGTYVARSIKDEYTNYFAKFKSSVVSVEGTTIDKSIEELKKAMAAKETYSVVINDVNGQTLNLVYSPLPYSEWYLMTGMPFETLDSNLAVINRARVGMVFTEIILLIVVMVVLYVFLIRMFSSQVKQIKKSEQAAIEANRAKTEFLSNVSHDIRTPMNAIIGMSKIALDNLNDIRCVEECLRKSLVSSRHLMGLINDILDMTKMESGKMVLRPEVVPLAELMEGVVTVVRTNTGEKKQHLAVYSYNIYAENVYTDRTYLGRIILNLASNATKFTPEGGHIVISISQEVSKRGNEYVTTNIRVKDDGIGMHKDFIEHVFESFSREDTRRVQKTQGSGLGMAVTKKIVDMMGGTIEVASEPGKGTEFHVSVDFKVIQDEEKYELSGVRALVVDDCREIIPGAVDYIERMGAKAEAAESWFGIQEQLKYSYSGTKEWDVMLINWSMAEEDRRRVIGAVSDMPQEIRPSVIPLVYDWSEVTEWEMKSGIDTYVMKPVFATSLYKGIYKEILRTKESVERKEPAAFELAGERVLVAEDNNINWEIVEKLLGKRGIILERAETGKECLEKFTGSRINYYAAILMDIRMPEMDGYETTEAIRKTDRADRGLPIIAMTANAYSEDIDRCAECGMNGHIAKPIDIGKTCELLKKTIRFYRQGGGTTELTIPMMR